MQRKFVTNLAFLIFINLLVKPFWIFGIDRTVQNLVGAENYGLYYALFNFSFIFSIILDLGITNYNNRTIAQNNQLLPTYLSNILIVRLILAFLYFFLLIIFGVWLQFNSLQITMLAFLGCNQILNSLILYLRSNVSALHHFKTDSILSSLDKLLMIIIAIPLLWGNFLNEPFRIEWFVYIQTVAYFLTVLVCFIIVFGFVRDFKLKFEFPVVFSIIKETLPFASIMLLMGIYSKIDAVMLERMLGENGAREAGIYATAYRLTDALTMIGFLFSVPLLPMFSKMIKQQLKTDDLVKLSFTLIFIFSSTTAITGYFFQNEIMSSLYHETNENSGKILGMLLFAFISTSSVYIFGSLLVANNNMFSINAIVFSGVILNISLNYFLIPEYHAFGAAMAAACTQTVMALLHILFAVKFLHLKINWKYIFQLLFFFTSVCIINYFLKNIFSFWLINSGLAIILSAFSALLFRLVDWKKILGFISQLKNQ